MSLPAETLSGTSPPEKILLEDFINRGKYGKSNRAVFCVPLCGSIYCKVVTINYGNPVSSGHSVEINCFTKFYIYKKNRLLTDQAHICMQANG